MRRAAAFLFLALAAGRCRAADPIVVLDEDDFRDRVHACWLGKAIGGTLGMPVEGRRETHRFTFYTPVPAAQAPNDDLDLALLWVAAAEEHGAAVDAHVLAGSWLKYVCVDWNEYGVARKNLRAGFPPPLSGHVRNERWRDSNGAWIRSETWACLLPGCPALAAGYAWEDACVDHGASEGTAAELFTAALQSAAFVERDIGRLVEIGLSWLPPDSATAAAVRAAVAARRDGAGLEEARTRVVAATESTGWFMAPRNVGFVVLGLLYGEGDFGKTICATVNCGDDTDSTGATAGATMGILLGSKGISEEWRRPVGEGIANIAISGFPSPKDLGELTEGTLRAARRLLAETGAPVAVRRGGPADLSRAGELPLEDLGGAAALWSRRPLAIALTLGGVRMRLDLSGERIPDGGFQAATLHVRGPGRRDGFETAWRAGEGLLVRAGRMEAAFRAGEVSSPVLTASVEVFRSGRSLGTIPFAFLGAPAVSKGDLALASLGTKASSDSELDREPGCTARVIDGDIEGDGDCGGRRWHSALAPHPHWVSVELPSPRKVARAVIHPADPDGYPVDFDGEGSLDGKAWVPLFSERGSKEARRIVRTFPATELRYFRLTVRASANPKFPDAAQLREIELLER